MKKSLKQCSKRMISMMLIASMVGTNVDFAYATTEIISEEINIVSEDVIINDEQKVTNTQESLVENNNLDKDEYQEVNNDLVLINPPVDMMKPDNDLVLINPPVDMMKPDNDLILIDPPVDTMKPDNDLVLINPPVEDILKPDNQVPVINNPVNIPNYDNVPKGTEIAFYGNGEGGLLFDKVIGKTRNGNALAITNKEFAYGVVSAEIVYKDGVDVNDHTLPSGDDGAGYDFGTNNGIVRSFDIVTYQVDFSYNKEDESNGTVIIEAIAPEGDYKWDTTTLEKLGYNVTANDDYSEIKLTFTDFRSGSGYSTKLPLYVGAQRNGDKFTPTFKIYEEGTTVEDKNTLVPDETTVSAKTNINILLNSKMLHPDVTQVDEYLLYQLGYELQVSPLLENKGTIKGMQYPLEDDVFKFVVKDINAKHTPPSSQTGTNKNVYIYDYGYNNGLSNFHNVLLTNAKMGVGKNTDTTYFLPSKEDLKVSDSSLNYVYNSGEMNVERTDGNLFVEDFMQNRYGATNSVVNNEFVVTVSGATGFEDNVTRIKNLRANGVTFSTGAIVLAFEAGNSPQAATGSYDMKVDATLSDTFEMTSRDENNIMVTKTVNDAYTNDNSANAVKQARTGSVSYYNRFADNQMSSGNTIERGGIAERPMGHSDATYFSSTSIKHSYYEKYKAVSQVVIFDPRAFEFSDKEANADYYNAVELDGGTRTAAPYTNIVSDKFEFLYGVYDFSGVANFDDYTRAAETKVTSSDGVSAYMDLVEKEIFSLDGYESGWQWFETVKEAKLAEDHENGLYLCAYRGFIPQDDLFEQTGGFGQASGIVNALMVNVNIRVNDYTKYLEKNRESTAVATNIRFYTVPSDIAYFDRDADYEILEGYRNTTDFGAFGYRKSVYDPKTDAYIKHSSGIPGPGNSVFITKAAPKIDKNVRDENYNLFSSNPPTLVPGVDKVLWWEINAYTNNDIPVTPEDPFIVTDVINTQYLEFDKDSISPKNGDIDGMTLEIDESVEGQIKLIWTFTNGPAGFFYEGFKYKTVISKDAPSGYDFNGDATVEFLGVVPSPATASATVVTDSNLLIYKEVDKAIINNTHNLEYTLNFKNRSEKSETYDLYDIFPYNGDYRKNNFSGYLELTNITSSYSDIIIEYTFDENLKFTNLHNATFKTEDAWGDKDIKDATGVHIKINDVPPAAEFDPNNPSVDLGLHSITLNFDTFDNEGSDVIYNDFTMRYKLDGVTIPIVSNIVRSTVPVISKSVALNEDSSFVEDLGIDPLNEFVYKIDMFVPSVGNDQKVNDIKISDKLDDAIQFVSGKLIDKDGNDVTDYFGTLTEKDGLVTFNFENKLEEIPENEYSLMLDVKLKENYDLSSYVDEKVPNVATLTVDDVDLESNEVTVFVPKIKKSIETIDGVNSDDKLNIDYNKQFIYNIDFGVSKYSENKELTSLVISDKLEPVLKYVSAKLVDETGNDVTNKFGVITENNNLVEFTFTNLEEAQGKRFTLKITVEIPSGADLGAYIDHKIPNVASMTINNEPAIDSNEVIVEVPEIVNPVDPVDPVDPTDPKDPIVPKPEITKGIGKTEDIKFSNSMGVTIGEEFVYKIEISVPGYNQSHYVTDLVISDQLDPVLKFIDAKLVDSEGNDVTDYFGSVSEKNNLVQYNFVKNVNQAQGKSFSLLITVEIPKEADLSNYVNNEITNVASLTLNKNVIVNSNEVIATVEDKTNLKPVNPIIPVNPVKPINPINPTNPVDPEFPQDLYNLDESLSIGTADSESLLDLDGDGVPFGTGTKTNPKTGDISNNLVLILGLNLLMLLFISNRKKRHI